MSCWLNRQIKRFNDSAKQVGTVLRVVRCGGLALPVLAAVMFFVLWGTPVFAQCGGATPDTFGRFIGKQLGGYDGNSSHSVDCIVDNDNGGHCDIKIKVTIAATTDTSHEEDVISLNHIEVGRCLPGTDSSTFLPAKQTFVKTITVPRNQWFPFDVQSLDGDDGSFSATILNVEVVSDTSSCSRNTGTGGTSGGSVRFYANLGLGAFNASVGSLGFESELPATSLLRPAALLFNGNPASYFAGAASRWTNSDGTVTIVTPGVIAGVDVVTSNTFFRQIKSPSGLADIVSNSPTAYDIRFYGTNQVGNKVNGLWTTNGTPYRIWSVLSGDGSSSGSNILFKEIIVASSSTNTTRAVYTSQGITNIWAFTEGTAPDTRTTYHSKATYLVAGVTNITIVDTICDGASNVVSVTRERHVVYNGVEQTVERVVDPNGFTLTNSWWYDANANMIAMQQPNGYWEVYKNDNSVSGTVLSETLSPWLNQPLSTNQILALAAAPIGDASGFAYHRKSVANHYVVYQPIVTTTLEYIPSAAGPVLIQNQIATTYADNSVTNVQYVQGGVNVTSSSMNTNINYTWSRLADGTVSIYGSVDDGTTRVETTWAGVPGVGMTNVTNGTCTVRTTAAAGNLISEKTWSVYPTNYLIASKVVSSNDVQNRPIRIDYQDGTYEIFNYNCCGISDQRDRDGTWTHNSPDTLKRIMSQTKAGVVTVFSYDAADRVINTWRWVGGFQQLVSSNKYDTAGRLIATVDALGHTNNFSEVYTSDGFTVRTTTTPDGSTCISRSYLDNQSVCTMGTGVHPRSNEYGVVTAPNGFTYRYVKTYALGVNGETSEWVMNVVDNLGRTYEAIYPDGAFSYNVYDASNHLVKTSDPDGVTLLASYNSLGEQEYTAVDVNGNGQIDFTGPDRVTRTFREYGVHGTATVQRVTTMVYAQDNSAVPLTNSVQENSFATREQWSSSFGLTNYSVATMKGDTNLIQNTAPNGSYAKAVIFNGLQLAATNYASDASVLGFIRTTFDTAGRPVSAIDATGLLVSNVYNNADQVTTTILQPSGMVPRTNCTTFDLIGRPLTGTQPDGTIVTNQYYLTGEVQLNCGSRTYPANYTFDSQGRMVALKTWQNYATSNGAAVTCWTNDPQRGFLTSKTYADGKGTLYTYTHAGRLATRTWVRGVVTTYQYNSAGDLSIVTYSDSTPATTNLYNRLGRIFHIYDVSGERALTYNNAGQLLSEIHENNILAGLGVQRQYDSLLRVTNITATVSGSGKATNSVRYAYDAASRLKRVMFGTSAVAYTYLTNQSVGAIGFTNGAVNVMTTTRLFDGMGQMTNVFSKVAGQVIAGNAYGYNLAGQRTNCVLNDGSVWNYKYDFLGQVTNGTRQWSDGQAVAGQSFAYQFDDIGNRKSAVRDGDQQTYTPNSLNQYTQRTVPGAFWVEGDATNNAGIQINGVAATRHSAFFSSKLTVDNSTQAIYTNIVAVGIGTNGSTVVTNTVTGHAFTPQTPEIVTYDFDGNLTSDGRWTYTWDAENRLIAMTATNKVGTAVPAVRLQFTYDSNFRRVRKQVFNWSTNTANWALFADYFYAYDGWNLIHEERRPDGFYRNLNMDYAWGLDVSGSMQGAGGVGGLLGISKTLPTTNNLPPAVYYTAYDANGNVTTLVATNGSIAASYLYSPVGETLVAVGPVARDNPIRFSTKVQDDETGLIVYTFRLYSPTLERWLSRDPLGEAGSLNNYAFCENDPLNSYDYLGMSCDLRSVVMKAAKNAAIRFGEIWAAKKAVGIATKQIVEVVPVAGQIIGGAFLVYDVGDTAWSAYNIYRTRTLIEAQVKDFLNDPDLVQRIKCLSDNECDELAGKIGNLLGSVFANRDQIAAGLGKIKDLLKGMKGAGAAEKTNAELIQEVATRAEDAVGGTGRFAGTEKHTYAKRLFDKYQGIYGDRGLKTETTWLNGVQYPYGTKGAPRIDVLDVNANWAYDYKFTVTPPGLSPGQTQRIMTHGPAGLQGVLEVNP